MDVDDFIRDRDEALRSLDIKTISAYKVKYGGTPMTDTAEQWAGVHKARVIITDFPEDLKQVSREWLSAHGYKIPEFT